MRGAGIPPRLSVPLVLESPERQPDGMGGFRLHWVAQGRLWAEMRARSGAERFAEVGAQSVVTWAITVRAAPVGDPRRPRPDQRLRGGERLFRIVSVAETGADGRYLICTAREEKLA